VERGCGDRPAFALQRSPRHASPARPGKSDLDRAGRRVHHCGTAPEDRVPGQGHRTRHASGWLVDNTPPPMAGGSVPRPPSSRLSGAFATLPVDLARAPDAARGREARCQQPAADGPARLGCAFPLRPRSHRPSTRIRVHH
jgi:hypothetical protein